MPARSVDDLIALASSDEPEDRLVAARSRRCPPDILAHLAEHGGAWKVSTAAWSNPCLPETLLREEAARVAEGRHSPAWLLRNPNVPGDALAAIARMEVLAHRNYPPALMAAHADPQTGDKQHRKHLANNPALPQDIQEMLARDPYERVRLGLARNRTISRRTVEVLMDRERPGARVLRALSRVPAAAPLLGEILALLADGTRTDLDPVLARHTLDMGYVRRCVEGYSLLAREHALANPHLSAEMLVALCDDDRVEVRRAAVRHPRCPEEGQVLAALRGL